MSKSKSPPRLIQKLTGWSYTRSLHFAWDNAADAVKFSSEQGISIKDALLQMAEAEMEAE